MASYTVCDTGPLTHLSEADILYLLEEVDELIIPQTVHDELSESTIPSSLTELDYTIRSVEYSSEDHPTLDPGETAAIVLCTEIDAILLTDDLAAREVAEPLEIEVHGSLGIVLLAYAREVLTATEAKSKIRSLKRDTPLYLSDPLVEYSIQLIEDESDGW
jgi:predicted nucleic acid-binding protein